MEILLKIFRSALKKIMTRESLYQLIQKFISVEIIVDLPRRKRPHGLTNEMLEIIDTEIQNDELISQQL